MFIEDFSRISHSLQRRGFPRIAVCKSNFHLEVSFSTDRVTFSSDHPDNRVRGFWSIRDVDADLVELVRVVYLFDIVNEPVAEHSFDFISIAGMIIRVHRSWLGI